MFSTAYGSGNSHLSLRLYALKILVAIVRSTTHHKPGGFRKGRASENVFKLSFLIGQPVPLHVIFGPYTQFYFNQDPRVA